MIVKFTICNAHTHLCEGLSHDQDSEKQFQEGGRLRGPFLYIRFSLHNYGCKGQATLFEFSGSFRSARFFQTREGLKQMKIARHGQAEQSWMSGARTSNLPRGPMMRSPLCDASLLWHGA